MATQQDWIRHFNDQAKREHSGKRSVYSVSPPERVSTPTHPIQLISPVEHSTEMARATIKRGKRLGRPPGSGTNIKRTKRLGRPPGSGVKKKMRIVTKSRKSRKIKNKTIKKRILKRKKK
jgi:hypothetical protein